jgi:hypothetical protein
MVLLNHDEKKGKLIPNANVNIEYGLMLGFNKYLIPFQREKEVLPFNVAALDTVKYTDDEFQKKAREAIEIAVRKTSQNPPPSPTVDQVIGVFLLSKKLMFANIDSPGEKGIFNMGAPFGFLLFMDFSGMTYCFFGNFTPFRSEVVIWRLKMLNELLNARRESIKNRIQLGIMTPEQGRVAESLFSNSKMIILVTTDEDKTSILQNMSGSRLSYSLEVCSLNDMNEELKRLL